MTGALVLLLAASRGSAQQFSDECETCDHDFGSTTLRSFPCLAADPGRVGNTNCRTLIEPVVTTSGISARLLCLYKGDACFSMQRIGTYQAFRTAYLVFGFSGDSGVTGYNAFADLGGGCCTPDGTDWCGAWGMPAGCT
jgi:hypothetical protein